MKPLTIRLLGCMAVSRGSANLELPQSRKARALLGFLACARVAQRRDRLCALLWDIADDPRGALRWSLSRLRPLVDEPGARRIVADRDTVAFDPKGAFVDFLEIRKHLSATGDKPDTAELKRRAELFRGEFLEGLDLPDFHEFQAWRIATREEVRRSHASLLTGLVERLSDRPEDALEYARQLVRIDGTNESAHEVLIRFLRQTGRQQEAEQQYATARKLLREQGPTPILDAAWNRPVHLRTRLPAGVRDADDPGRAGTRGRPVGRDAELVRIRTSLRQVETKRAMKGVLLSGEPGIGKTSLLLCLADEVAERSGTVLYGSAYEAESGRPYGPWIEALRRVPAVSVGQTIGSDVAQLLPDLPFSSPPRQTKDRLFGAVVDLIAARAHSAPPVLVALDDAQWYDEASAELLHYAARMSRNRPVFLAIAARDGELAGNGPMRRVILGLQRDGLLEDVAIGPLDREHCEELVRSVEPKADPERIFALSAGNPLYALELARSRPEHKDGVPPTLVSLVQERVACLPGAAVETIRWCSVLGRTFSARRVGEVTRLAVDELMSTLETLERLALVRAIPGTGPYRNDYEFLTDVVRQVVYAGLSEPRRRLMHQRVAEAIHQLEGMDDQTAAEIAHHAALGGDAGRAAGACVAAARRCLRLFANTEAESLARKGMGYAAQLKDPEQVQRLLELTQISIAARRPQKPLEKALEIEALAERALDFGCFDQARLGFHLLSLLRWEDGHWADAEQTVMRAEQVSRGAGESEKVIAMADAARCLALLERDLATAERLVVQAGVLGARIHVQPAAIPIAEGLLRLHEGNLEDAVTLFEHARLLARTEGDRHSEYQALEWLVILEIRCARYSRAGLLAPNLVAIGEKLRDGSEAPFAHALSSICRCGSGDVSAAADLDRCIEELRMLDAKHRLVYILTCAAETELRSGNAESALRRASSALEIAHVLELKSEIVLSLSLLAEASAALKRRGDSVRWTQQLRAIAPGGLSSHACRVKEQVLKRNRVWSR